METDAAGADGVADFDETFREHYWSMVRSLAGVCGDREVAADAVQEAFTRAFVRWRRISRYDSPAAWVRHVALNRVRDHVRREQRGARARERLGESTVAPAPTVDDDIVHALDELPTQQRVAVSLFYFEQLSVREIAASMKLSEGAVKFHLHAGRQRLREWLERG
jgi:RNA polymerase sigma-70 factor, ECF subfamily